MEKDKLEQIKNVILQKKDEYNVIEENPYSANPCYEYTSLILKKLGQYYEKIGDLNYPETLEEIYQNAEEKTKKSGNKYIKYKKIPELELLFRASRIDGVKSKYLKESLLKDDEELKRFLDDNSNFGFFGAGKGEISDCFDVKHAVKFLCSCIKINRIGNPQKIEDITKTEDLDYFSEEGMIKKAGIVSQILHCIKPKIFPILNGNEDKGNLFYVPETKSNAKTKPPIRTSQYIEICKTIEKERAELNESLKKDGYPEYTNYRIFDLLARKITNNKENRQDIIKTLSNGDKDMTNDKQPLNQILYGPPGTGKTYNTVVEAIKILDKSLYFEYEKSQKEDVDYKKLKNRFGQLKDKEKRIKFITFHQSYSYEEFVEGIKPKIDWKKDNKKITEEKSAESKKDDDKKDAENFKDIQYIGADGVFKTICDTADSLKEEPSKSSQEDLYKKAKEIYEKNKDNYKKNISFEDVIEILKEKLKDNPSIPNRTKKGKFKIVFGDDNSISYIRGRKKEEKTPRTIDLEKIKKIFDENKSYEKTEGFFKDYNDGVETLACYPLSFYCFLMDIKAKFIEENNNNFSEEEIIEEIVKELIDEEKRCVLIIDEINRGNISKIFGELITLLEEDKREGADHELSVTLPYSKKEFRVPNNLYIIGTMNTSDRSIASVDIALRRRFKFKEMMPKPVVMKPTIPSASNNYGNIQLQDLFKKLNKRICALLDRDHQIGHSYFIGVKDVKQLKDVWFDCIIPLLNEYFYGDWDKLQAILGKAGNNSFIKSEGVDENLFPDGIKKEDVFDGDEYYEFAKKEDFDNENFLKALSHAFPTEVETK